MRSGTAVALDISAKHTRLRLGNARTFAPVWAGVPATLVGPLLLFVPGRAEALLGRLFSRISPDCPGRRRRRLRELAGGAAALRVVDARGARGLASRPQVEAVQDGEQQKGWPGHDGGRPPMPPGPAGRTRDGSLHVALREEGF